MSTSLSFFPVIVVFLFVCDVSVVSSRFSYPNDVDSPSPRSLFPSPHHISKVLGCPCRSMSSARPSLVSPSTWVPTTTSRSPCFLTPDHQPTHQPLQHPTLIPTASPSTLASTRTPFSPSLPSVFPSATPSKLSPMSRPSAPPVSVERNVSITFFVTNVTIPSSPLTVDWEATALATRSALAWDILFLNMGAVGEPMFNQINISAKNITWLSIAQPETTSTVALNATAVPLAVPASDAAAAELTPVFLVVVDVCPGANGSAGAEALVDAARKSGELQRALRFWSTTATTPSSFTFPLTDVAAHVSAYTSAMFGGRSPGLADGTTMALEGTSLEPVGALAWVVVCDPGDLVNCGNLLGGGNGVPRGVSGGSEHQRPLGIACDDEHWRSIYGWEGSERGYEVWLRWLVAAWVGVAMYALYRLLIACSRPVCCPRHSPNPSHHQHNQAPDAVAGRGPINADPGHTTMRRRMTIRGRGTGEALQCVLVLLMSATRIAALALLVAITVRPFLSTPSAPSSASPASFACTEFAVSISQPSSTPPWTWHYIVATAAFSPLLLLNVVVRQKRLVEANRGLRGTLAVLDDEQRGLVRLDTPRTPHPPPRPPSPSPSCADVVGRVCALVALASVLLLVVLAACDPSSRSSNVKAAAADIAWAVSTINCFLVLLALCCRELEGGCGCGDIGTGVPPPRIPPPTSSLTCGSPQGGAHHAGDNGESVGPSGSQGDEASEDDGEEKTSVTFPSHVARLGSGSVNRGSQQRPLGASIAIDEEDEEDEEDARTSRPERGRDIAVASVSPRREAVASNIHGGAPTNRATDPTRGLPNGIGIDVVSSSGDSNGFRGDGATDQSDESFDFFVSTLRGLVDEVPLVQDRGTRGLAFAAAALSLLAATPPVLRSPYAAVVIHSVLLQVAQVALAVAVTRPFLVRHSMSTLRRGLVQALRREPPNPLLAQSPRPSNVTAPAPLTIPSSVRTTAQQLPTTTQPPPPPPPLQQQQQQQEQQEQQEQDEERGRDQLLVSASLRPPQLTVTSTNMNLSRSNSPDRQADGFRCDLLGSGVVASTSVAAAHDAAVLGRRGDVGPRVAAQLCAGTSDSDSDSGMTSCVSSAFAAIFPVGAIPSPPTTSSSSSSAAPSHRISPSQSLSPSPSPHQSADRSDKSVDAAVPPPPMEGLGLELHEMKRSTIHQPTAAASHNVRNNDGEEGKKKGGGPGAGWGQNGAALQHEVQDDGRPSQRPPTAPAGAQDEVAWVMEWERGGTRAAGGPITRRRPAPRTRERGGGRGGGRGGEQDCDDTDGMSVVNNRCESDSSSGVAWVPAWVEGKQVVSQGPQQGREDRTKGSQPRWSDGSKNEIVMGDGGGGGGDNGCLDCESADGMDESISSTSFLNSVPSPGGRGSKGIGMGFNFFESLFSTSSSSESTTGFNELFNRFMKK